MGIRSQTNSLTLRQDFPKTYQDLFSVCQVAVSTADSFFWAGEYARFFGGLVIQQKLPTKNIVGLEITNQPKISFADKLYGYNPQKHQFEAIPFDSAKEKRLINFLEAFWPTLDPDGKIPGFRIHIISESHCGGGLGTTGVLLSCLAACFHLLAGKITPQEINGWLLHSTQELITAENFRSFQDLFRLAWRLTAICRDGNSSGATSFAAMTYSPYPIIYFSGSVNKHLSDPCITNPANPLEYCRIINELPFWGGTLEEIFSIRLPQPWPIDIGRIYSGNLINTENIFKILSNLQTSLNFLKDNLEKELTPKIVKQHLTIRNLFSENINQSFSYNDFIDIFNINSLKLLFSWKELFELGPNEDTLRRFTQVIHQLYDFSHFLGHSTPILDQICEQMTNIVASGNEYGIAGAKIEGIGKGGHTLFIGPAGTMPPNITNKIQKIAQNLNKDIHLDWASWIDGYGESGLEVEQYTPKKIFSSFISPQSYILTIYRSNQKEIKIVNRPELDAIIPQYDLLLSPSNHKIYIKGKMLSSKEIPSAKAAVDIIQKIISSPDNKIDNRAFSNTSYGQSRYDLQSKIFIPLKKALQKIANQNLDFHISGGMYDNYSVALNFKSLSIAILEEIAH